MTKAKQRALRDTKAARGGGQFLPIPLTVLRSQEFALLSPHALKLLVDLLAQYQHPLNNGDLAIAWSMMERRGWKSKATLYRACKELLDGGWVIVTRPGGRHRATLYALTFYRIDECRGKHDVKATSTPPNDWMRGKSLGTPTVPIVRVSARQVYQ